MYELFQQAGTPLPKDPNLIDYGFKFEDDFEEKQKKQQLEIQKKIEEYPIEAVNSNNQMIDIMEQPIPHCKKGCELVRFDPKSQQKLYNIKSNPQG